MSTLPFDIDMVIDRLRGSAPGFRRVGRAASVADIRQREDLATPGAYVLPPTETANAKGPTTGKTTAVDARFSVAIVVARYRERKTPNPEQRLSELIGQVRAALMGWTAPSPAQYATAPVFDGGALADEDTSTVIWVDTWRLTHAMKA